MTAIRGAKIPNGYRFEYDLMQDVRDRLNRKIEIDGEKALELALAEVGYVKERTCNLKLFKGQNEYSDVLEGVCSKCGAFMDSQMRYCPNCGRKVVE